MAILSGCKKVIVKTRYRRRLSFKYCWISLLTCLLLLSPIAPGWAQDLSGSFGWKSFRLEGDAAYVPVRLDGYNLFSIAAARTKEGGGQLGLGNLQIRRDRIEKRLQSQLQDLIASDIQPASIQVITTRLNKQMAVQAVIEGKATKPLLTVTSLDAEIYGLTESEVAEEHAQQIRQAFLRALQERQPTAQQAQLHGAAIGGMIATLLMALLVWGQRQISKARRRLRQEFHDRRGSAQPPIPVDLDADTIQKLTEKQQQLFELKRRIEQKTWQKRILQLLWIGVGLVGFAWVLQRFPQTRSLGVLAVRQPIVLLLIGLSTTLAIIGSHSLVDWLLAQWVGTEDTTPMTLIKRRRKRVPTLSAVWKNVITILLLILGAVLAFSSLSVSTGLSLFTEIGVLGVVISLAFQSVIKDALSGWMLLVFDAYTVGDLVTPVNSEAGIVEAMGLLMTQIRNSAGDLITVRNGEITSVTNRSRDWARMDFTVLVDYDTDTKQAMALMQAVFESMQADPTWASELIGEPDILGIEQFDVNGILLKIRTQTKPLQQFGVTREFRLRLNQAFRDAGIKIPIPQREVRHRT